MSKKLLFNNSSTASPEPEPPIEGHYYETCTNYPIEVENEKLCPEHKSYLLEIQGNTENGKLVGELQADGTYKITLIVIGGE